MAIQVADNFQYLGQKPLDARVKYATVADMAAVAASSLYDGIMAYVVATEKNYQWKSTNTVDPTLGKWREFQSGGGDVTGRAKSTSIAPVFDDTATYAVGDRVTYEDELYVFNKAHTGEWAAADADKTDVDSEIPDKLTSQQMQAIKNAFVIDAPRNGYPVLFDETGAEHFVGWYKYANGTKQPVYEKTIVDTVPTMGDSKNISTGVSIKDVVSYNCIVRTSAGGYNAVNSNTSQDADITSFLKCYVYNNASTISENRNCIVILNRIKTSGWDEYSAVITLQYTKTTDTPQ